MYMATCNSSLCFCVVILKYKDSYIVHPLPFIWHEGSPRVISYSLSTQNLAWIPILRRDLTSAMGIVRSARDVVQYPEAQSDGNRGREAENADQDATVTGLN